MPLRRHSAKNRSRRAEQASGSAPSTHTATSATASTSNVRLTRIAPSSPSSSSPAVSVTRQGPSGGISIAFETGSVVVPGTSLTIATSWPVKAFTSVDLPAFLGPKNAMRSLFAEGVSCISAIAAYYTKFRGSRLVARGSRLFGKQPHRDLPPVSITV